jgi:prepilin-type N-terminal cleavage/methylation domain-containing protein
MIARWSKGKAAFALFELLVVIAIIGILASLLFPAAQRAKLASKRTAAMVQGRQIVMALTIYRGDHDDGWPQGGLDTFVSDERLLFAEGDPFVGGFARAERVYPEPPEPGPRISWESWYRHEGAENWPSNYKYLTVRFGDANPGVIALRTYRERSKLNDPPEAPTFVAYHGPFVRVRLDTSAKIAHYRPEVVVDKELGVTTTTFPLALHFTDNKEVKPPK